MKRPVVIGCCLWITGYVLALYTELRWLSLMTSALLLAALIVIYALRLPGRQPLCALLLVGVAYGYFQWTDQRNVSALLPLAQQAGKPGRQRGHAARPILQPCHRRRRQGQLHDGSGVHPLPGRGRFPARRGKRAGLAAPAPAGAAGGGVGLAPRRRPDAARDAAQPVPGPQLRRLRLPPIPAPSPHPLAAFSQRGGSGAGRACGCALKRRPAAALERRAARCPQQAHGPYLPRAAGGVHEEHADRSDGRSRSRALPAIFGAGIDPYFGHIRIEYCCISWCLYLDHAPIKAGEGELFANLYMVIAVLYPTDRGFPLHCSGRTHVYNCSLCS